MTDTTKITASAIGIGTLLFYVFPRIRRTVLRIWNTLRLIVEGPTNEEIDLEQEVLIAISPIENNPNPLPLAAPQARKRTPYTFHDN
ncbi:uncharacterized protein N7498_010025 [Penicillium cinerascens]|uniref:Uncharacterized protein n=1 Tax=Penicillium cinerascens TaxID=70096 RepID=A0A9W9J9Z9_9EURO|nr:uncharacterized protein N7498_010025 [Penicillium cinerascens]KAJ5191040.1 hypothetical protein N7498_010025 [Penicillium cinerascens]